MKKTSSIFLLLVFIACTTGGKKGSSTISGIYKGGQGQIITLSELKTQRLIQADSALVNEEGKFRLEITPVEKSFYLLQFENRQALSLVIDKNESLNIALDTNSRNEGLNISGNTETTLLMEYYKKTEIVKESLDSLRTVLFDSQALEHFAIIKLSIDSTLKNLLENHKHFTENLIRNNSGSLASILLINQSFAGKQLFDMDENLELYTAINDSLNKKYPANSHVKEHHARVTGALEKQVEKEKAEARVSPGKTIPEIKLPDVSGKQVSLSSLKGKNVILFFWASWSPECRADIQMLKKLYQQHQEKDFEIYAVSLDHQEKYWKSAVTIESLEWINVSDLSGNQSLLPGLFNLSEGIPYYFLLNKEGIIVAKTGSFSEIKEAFLELIGHF
ncbi:MAG: peroxiredoxin family protein [Bacteroidales bacterium]|nr:peroxiredoxin family protein [Bacteroidales bacterium]